MSRYARLTPKQWEEAAKLLADRVSYRAIAAKFGCSESTIRKGLDKLLDLANKKVQSDIESRAVSNTISALSEPHQRVVNVMAERLTKISEHMASAAQWAAMSADHCAELANMNVKNILKNPLGSAESIEALRSFKVMTEMANLSAEIPIGLLRANKDAIDDLNKAGQQPPEPKQIVFTVVDASASA